MRAQGAHASRMSRGANNPGFAALCLQTALVSKTIQGFESSLRELREQVGVWGKGRVLGHEAGAARASGMQPCTRRPLAG